MPKLAREQERERERKNYNLRAQNPEYRAKRNAQHKAVLASKDPIVQLEKYRRWRAEYDQRPEVKAKLKARRNTERYRQQRRQQWRKRYATNVKSKLMHIQRAIVGNYLRRGKSVTAKYMLGCTMDFLKEHLERQFTGKMSWENHGTVWQIDHIQPLSKFDLSDIQQCRLAWNWQNLRPLLKKHNREKSDRVTVPQLHLPLDVSAPAKSQ